ncbi:diphthine methyl ester synthase-like isoform X2 [Hydractinia symbiolongicarpus]|uniref:diphthine methyl ester synthase-like isoform X2 n=1 Tax=Hydractinia symbiolongicarpus TaxID=13093 RepID=UPI00254F6524|nr:diphthine methyl ester synthase-like isoform X2 [Hydractinia symbiolongicarpus]
MLYLVGLGLGDSKDITVKGLEIVKKAHKVFLEAYTSILKGGKEELETFYGREVVLADRTLVEEEADEILSQAKENDVVFLVVGDPFGATTHTDLIIRARKKEIQYKVVHNASIMNAVGCCGLQLYNFGETVSIVMWSENWKPDSFYGKIIENKKRGLHTLCLLDIKVKEQTIENMIRGRKIYEPPCYLTAQDAMQQLLYVSDRRHAENKECSSNKRRLLCCHTCACGMG